MSKRLSSALWVGLPNEIRKPTDIAKYRDAIRTLVEDTQASLDVVDKQVRNSQSSTTLAGTGTVTRVGLSLPASEFSVYPAEVTTAGTLGVTWVAQGANKVLAGPVADSKLTFRRWSAASPESASSAINNGTLVEDTTITMPLNMSQYYPTDPWACRMTGQINLPAGQVTFRTLSDDGVRLYVNDQLVVENWTTHSEAYDTGSITTSGGWVSLQVDFFNSYPSFQRLRLEWLVGAEYVLVPGTEFRSSANVIATPTFRSLVDADIPNTIVRTSRKVNTSGPLAGGGALTSDLTLSIPRANASTDGYLDNDDWTTFNNKVSPTRQINTTSPLTGGGTLASDLTLGITQVSASVDGYLLKTDYSTFVGYQAQIDTKVPTTRTINTSAPLSGGGTLASDLTLSMPVATSVQNGYLSGTDHATFSAKVPPNRNISTTAPLAGGGTLSSDLILSMPAASAVQDGYLTQVDWRRFDAATQVSPDSDYYYIHTQTSASDTWYVKHGLPRVPTGILVVNSDGEVLDPAIEITERTEDPYYTHTQGSAASLWVINHGLGSVITGVTVLLDTGEYTDAAIEADQTSPFQVRVRFQEAVAGKAFVSTGADAHPLVLRFSAPRTGKAYISIGSDQPPYHHVQVMSSNDWGINHTLGRVPTQIKVFDSAGEIVEPVIVVSEASPYTVRLLFGASVSGDAWLT